MKKIINISGMSCENCSAHVKKSLEDLNNVNDVKVSLFKKRVIVDGQDLEEKNLIEAIEKAGYKVDSIEDKED